MKTKSNAELKESELIANHKKLVESFIKKNSSWKVGVRKKLMARYDSRVNKNNIRYYMNRSIKLFIIALVHDQLLDIADHFPKDYLTTNSEARA